MQSKTLFAAAVLCVVGVAGGSAIAGPLERVQPKSPQAPLPITPKQITAIQVQNCTAVPADLTMKLTGGVEAFSQGAYGHGPECSAFVADFQLDSNSGKLAPGSHQSPNYVFDGRDTVRETLLNPYSASNYHYYMKVTEAQCTSHKHQVHVYRKKAGESGFTLLGGGSLTPTWNVQGLGFGPVCLLAPSSGFKPIPQVTSPTTGVDVVRVVVDVPGAPGQMAASAMHPDN